MRIQAAVNRFEAAVIEFGPVPLPGALALFEQARLPSYTHKQTLTLT